MSHRPSDWFNLQTAKEVGAKKYFLAGIEADSNVKVIAAYDTLVSIVKNMPRWTVSRNTAILKAEESIEAHVSQVLSTPVRIHLFSFLVIVYRLVDEVLHVWKKAGVDYRWRRVRLMGGLVGDTMDPDLRLKVYAEYCFLGRELWQLYEIGPSEPVKTNSVYFFFVCSLPVISTTVVFNGAWSGFTTYMSVVSRGR